MGALATAHQLAWTVTARQISAVGIFLAVLSCTSGSPSVRGTGGGPGQGGTSTARTGGASGAGGSGAGSSAGSGGIGAGGSSQGGSSSAVGGGSAGAGGATSSGGAAGAATAGGATGGVTLTGGATTTGATISGGATSAGGTLGNGGASGQGGTTSTGGTTATGGPGSLSVRVVKTLNKDWKYIKQDVSGAEATAFVDTAWQAVHLPHAFEIPYWRAMYATAPYVGWYRKHITIDQSLIAAKERVFVEFEGVFQYSKIYVNGAQVGEHKGGYTGFSFDISSKLVAGDNVIAVRVDCSWNAQIAPRAGEYIFMGGIYRDVYVVVTDPLHVPFYGTFVTTKQATSSSATVEVQTEIQNDAGTAKTCEVKSTILDATGTVVATLDSTHSIPAGTLYTFVQDSTAIPNPHLWSPSSPYMYSVYTQVYDNTTLVDDYSSPLGIRTVRWDKDNGFFLSENHLWLQGANVHQDHAGWGYATTNSGSWRDVQMIKDAGMNFIRASHYPHDPAFLDATDHLGICVWSELNFWGTGYFSSTDPGTAPWDVSAYPPNQADQAPFEANVLQQLGEMIRIYRNHPSIVAWSMANEVEFTASSVNQNTKDLLAKMIAATHQADATRPAGLGGTWSDYVSIADVNGYNGGEAGVRNPGVPNMQTEYGSCTDDRPGTYDGCYNSDLGVTGNLPTQFAWRSGVSIWCAFHHGSALHQDNVATNPDMGNMGFIDHARLPLRRYYFYRNYYAGIAPPTWPAIGTPAKLSLTADNAAITDDGRSDTHLIVEVQSSAGVHISNSPDITLTDTSGLGMFPTGSTITFAGGALEKGVRDGQAAIELRSYNAGTITIQATSPGLASSSVTIVVNHVPDPPLSTAQITQ